MKRAILLLCILPLPVSAVEPAWAGRWREDLQFLRQQLPRVHPAPFNAIPAAELDRELAALAERLPELSHGEITTELSRIVARIGDGHTRLTWPLPPDAEFVLGHTGTAAPKDPALVIHPLPIRLGIYDDGVFVERIASDHAEVAGAQLLAIDEVPIDEVIRRLDPVIARDNPSQLLDLLPLHLVLAEVLHARKVTSDPRQASFRLRLVNGRIETVTLGGAAGFSLLPPPTLGGLKPAAPLSWKRLLPQRLPGRGAFLERHWMEWLPAQKTLYLQLNESYDDPDETLYDFAARVRATVEEKKAEALVLDLRYNFGGDNTLNQPLLHALIASDRLRGPGRVRVLIGRGTFSAAMMLALDLEKHVHPIFIGEPTGGRPVSYGDSRKLVLPKTGITVRVSTLFWQYSGPNDTRESITPHITAPILWTDVLHNHDAALEIALGSPSPPRPTGTWTGRMTLDRTEAAMNVRFDAKELDLEGVAAKLKISDVVVDGTRITFRSELEGKPLLFEAIPLGPFLVGQAVFDTRRGNPFPFAIASRVIPRVSAESPAAALDSCCRQGIPRRLRGAE